MQISSSMVIRDMDYQDIEAIGKLIKGKDLPKCEIRFFYKNANTQLKKIDAHYDPILNRIDLFMEEN